MWHRPSRWTLAAFAFAVLTAVVAWLVLGGRERTLRLADGREFSVVAVTYGTRHILDEGPPWAKVLARGSRSMAYRFGYRSSGAYTSAVPSVMVWTQWSPQNTNVSPRFASVADSTGAETEPDYACISGPVAGGAGGTLVGWRFENYPRCQDEFRLRFHEFDLFRMHARRDGEVTVRNPVRAARPSSLAPVAPVRTTNGTLEITLASLRCGGPPPRRPLTSKSAIAPWATAEFEFRESGQPTTDWTIKRIEMFGATGNHVTGDRLAVELEEGRRVARFAAALWREEPDWRLIAETVPTRNVPAEKLWTVKLPASAFHSGTLTTNLESVGRGLSHFRLAIEPMRVAGRGHQAVSLKANFTPATSDLHVDIVGAADSRGRELRITPSFLPRMGACEATMELPAGADSVDLTFAVQRSRKVEFRVRPEFVSTNAPLNKP
jgi:hypothetical protein